jgi:tryptophan halogenase
MAAFKRLVVVGGGSSGWMAAAAAATTLRGVDVTVVESEEIGIIGVGEAAFPSIRAFNQLLGIGEADFLRATRGSFKLGIQFCDWLRPRHSYFHTFGDFFPMEGSMALWGQYRRQREGIDWQFDELNIASLMARQGRFAVPQVPPGQEAPFNYAYHAGWRAASSRCCAARTAASRSFAWPTGAWSRATSTSTAPASPRC